MDSTYASQNEYSRSSFDNNDKHNNTSSTLDSDSLASPAKTNKINGNLRSLEEEIGLNSIYPFEPTMDHHSSLIVKLTDEGVEAAAGIMKESISLKRRRGNDEKVDVYSKSHMCLLCFNEGISLRKCFMMVSGRSSGNLNKHLENTHKILPADLKLKDVEFQLKYKRTKDDLLNNISDLDLFYKPLQRSSFSYSYKQENEEFQKANYKQFINILQLYSGQEITDVPNRNSSKKIAKKIYEEEKAKIKEEINETAKLVKESGGLQFLSIQHDDVAFHGNHFTGSVMSYITKDWKKQVIPLRILPNFKNEDGSAIVRKAVEEYAPLGLAGHFIGDNEPYSFSKSKNLMSMAREKQQSTNIDDEDNDSEDSSSNLKSEPIQEEFDDLYDKNMNQGCISHLLNLCISYAVGLRVSSRKKGLLTHRHIPPTDMDAKLLIDKIITLNKMALTYENSNNIKLIARDKNLPIYKPQLINATRWTGLYMSIRVLLKMYNIWNEVSEMKDLLKEIDMKHVNELFIFAQIFYEVNNATQYRDIPICAWYGVLICSLIHNFGINIGKKGLSTTYQDIFDKSTSFIHGQCLWNPNENTFTSEFVTNPISIYDMTPFGQQLYKHLASHVAYRFLPNDGACKVPDIFIFSTLSHPYTKSYARLMLGKECTIQQQEQYLNKAMKRFLPNQYNKSQSSSSSSQSSTYNRMNFLALDEDIETSPIMQYLNHRPDKITWSTSHSLHDIINAIPFADPLEYWRSNNNHQQIKALNMILLGFDISSAATEGVFSSLKETISSRRLRLSIDLMSISVTTRYILNKKNYNNGKEREDEIKDYMENVLSDISID